MSKKAPSPSAASLHPQAGPAPSPYQQRLDTVDATTRTADNILTVVSDPRKAWAVAILVGLVVVVYFLFRSSIKKGLTSLWDLLAAPFRQQRQEAQREDTVQRLTGQSADYTLTPAQALAVADQLYNCINWTGERVLARRKKKIANPKKSRTFASMTRYTYYGKAITPPPPAKVWTSVTYDLANGIPQHLRALLQNAQNVTPRYNPNTGEMTVSFTLEHDFMQHRIATLKKKLEFHLRARQSAQASRLAPVLTALLVAEREYLYNQVIAVSNQIKDINDAKSVQ